MKLLTEVNENLDFIIEESGNGKNEVKIKGIFMQAEQKNKNGRMYPIDILRKEVGRYTEQFVKAKRAFGELGHPEGPTINLDKVSHMILDLKEDNNNFIGTAKLMDTPMGNIAKSLIKEGARLGVSSRGMGTVSKNGDINVVQKDFYLSTAADIVADPSAPDAFVEAIYEGKSWVWENGLIKEKYINNMKNKLNNYGSEDSTNIKINVFKDFISKL